MAEYTPTSNTILIQHITETRTAIQEIQEDIGIIRERLAKLPCDVHEERDREAVRRIGEIEVWQKRLWGRIMSFVGIIIAVIQFGLHFILSSSHK